MILCEFCKSEVPDESRFCGRCGRLVEKANRASEQGATTLSDPHLESLPTLGESANPQAFEQQPTLLSDPDSNFLGGATDPDRQSQTTLEGSTELGLGFLASPAGFLRPVQGNAPMVQGTPPAGGVPSVPGTPELPGHAGMYGSAEAPHSAFPKSHQPQHQSAFPRPHQPQPHQPLHQAAYHQAASAPPGHPLNQAASAPGHSLNQAATAPGRPLTEGAKASRMTGGAKGQRGCRPSCLTTAVSTVVIIAAAITAALLLQLGHTHATQAALILNGNIAAGGGISIHGRNFTPGGTVSISIDGHPASIASVPPGRQASNAVNTSTALSLTTFLAAAVHSSGSTITVRSDGTFDVTVKSDPNWPAGSSHTLIATEQSSGQTAQLAITIPQVPKLSGCGQSTTTNTLLLGPVNAGQKQPIAASFTLCSTGSGIVSWTASWDQQQAAWLHLAQSGSIQAPLTQQVPLSASANGLQAGKYSTTVTFSSPNSSTQIILTITLTVRAPQAQPAPQLCLSTTSLNFGAMDPNTQQTQTVTVTNCGAQQLTWQADPGGLGLDMTSGKLDASKSQTVQVTVDTTNLGPGQQAFTVHFTSNGGSADLVVTVTVNTPQSTPTPTPTSPPSPSHLCLSTTSLDFGTMDPNTQQTKAVTVTNCGGQQLTWQADPGGLGLDTTSGKLDATLSQRVHVTVDTTHLDQGKHTFTAHFSSNGGSADLTVTVTVNAPPQPPQLCLNTTTLDFGTMDPNTQQTKSVTVTNCGGQQLQWQANGSQLVDSTSGKLDAGHSDSVGITMDTTNLDSGPHTFIIHFTSNGGSIDLTVTVTVNAPQKPPQLCLSTTSLDFGTMDPNTQQTQTLKVGNCGGQQLQWQASSKGPGLDTTSGNLNAGVAQAVQVTVDTSNLSSGKHTFTIFFSSNGGSAEVTVTVTVNASSSGY
jgi:hypothetical protein